MKVKVDDRKKNVVYLAQESNYQKQKTSQEMIILPNLWVSTLPEISRFCLLTADCDSVLPIAAYCYRLQKCHVRVPKHTDCGIYRLKL